MAPKTWKIDSTHSSISFLVRHMLVSRVRGAFGRFSGELRFAESFPAAAVVTACIDAASVDTNEPKRDAHLRSADFLDAANHPLIGFRSMAIERRGELLHMTGELTIRGVTRAVHLDVEYGGRMVGPDGVERIGFTGRGTISRKAFGITFNQVLDSGGLALGDKIDVRVDVAAVEVKQASDRQEASGELRLDA